MSKNKGSKELERLALVMAANCVRNTIIEDYHAEGKLSQEDMKNFNIEVSNKIYTFLHYLFSKPSPEKEKFLSVADRFYPIDWDKPKLDEDMLRVAKSNL